MAWTTITNALVAVGAKPFATTIQALRDNPIAIAEGATGAPVLSAAWHPFDMVNVGDGATGVIYDFAVNGAQASVTTPTFEDGYDYLIRWIGLSASNAASLQLDGVAVQTSMGGSGQITGYIEILAPTLPNFPKTGFVNSRSIAGSSAIQPTATAASSPFVGYFAFSNFATAMSSVTLSPSGGNLDAGQVLLYRRRNFMFG